MIKRFILNFILGVIVVFCSFTMATWLTHKLFAKFGTPPWMLDHVITSILGLLLMGSTIAILGRFFQRFRNSHIPVHAQMLADVKFVIDSIAVGNLNVKVKEESYDKREPLLDLISSVNKMVEEVGTMEKMRQDFVSNVSHEIQSPLTSIRGFAQLLRNENCSKEERAQYLDIIENESHRMSKLSANLLKLSTLEMDSHALDMNHFSLDQLLQKVLLSCEPQWASKQIELDIDLNKVTIKADKDLFSQVWINLVHNAIKFTPPQGMISVSLRKEADNAIVKITDTGIGISEEEKLHLFERFYKGDKSRNREKGGSGLGLAIVKKILDLHKGKIEVESELGKGATFTVTVSLGS